MPCVYPKKSAQRDTRTFNMGDEVCTEQNGKTVYGTYQGSFGQEYIINPSSNDIILFVHWKKVGIVDKARGGRKTKRRQQRKYTRRH